MNTQTIAVIGGTGKSGQYLVQNLLEKKYSIKLLIRNPENFQFQNPFIEVVKGDARDYHSVLKLLENCNVLLSTLGQPKGERTIFTDATENIINAMNHYQIKRYIVTTGLSVNTPFDNKSDHVKTATDWMYQNYPETTVDKQKEYNLLTQSDLDWTLIRLPLISLTNESFKTETSLEDCRGKNISATGLGEFLVSQIDDEIFIKKSPFLYNV